MGKRGEMSDLGFRLMSFMLWLHDLFRPVEKGYIKGMGIRKGEVVVDYGCGPGRHVKIASEIVGERGKVYAVDIQRKAIEVVKGKIEKRRLKNVVPVLAEGYSSGIKDNVADKIYALDMFHSIKEPDIFLRELHRILKRNGTLIIEDGHQPRKRAKEKILSSKLWKIKEEKKKYLKCVPV